MNRLEEKKKSLFRVVETADLTFIRSRYVRFMYRNIRLSGLDRITTRGESYFRFELDFELDPLSGR